MSILAVFSFENQEIRFVDGKPVGKDVATVLGYKDPGRAIRQRVSPKNKGEGDLPSIRYGENKPRMQKIIFLNEAGIYQLIFGSKLASAEQFQDWVFEEVLPSIRKTGSYSIAQPQPELEPIDIFSLDKRTSDLLEAWQHYREYPSLEAAWEGYNHPNQMYEGFATPDEAAKLDDRLKLMPDVVIRHIMGLWILGNMPYAPQVLEKLRLDFCDDNQLSAAQQFQAQLNGQLLPAADRKQLANN